MIRYLNKYETNKQTRPKLSEFRSSKILYYYIHFMPQLLPELQTLQTQTSGDSQTEFVVGLFKVIIFRIFILVI